MKKKRSQEYKEVLEYLRRFAILSFALFIFLLVVSVLVNWFVIGVVKQ